MECNESRTRNIVTHLLNEQITARLMTLYLYIKKYPDITPQKWLISQLNGASLVINKITSIFSNKLSDKDNVGIQLDLITLLQNTMLKYNQDRMIIAVDEAGTAHKYLSGRFNKEEAGKSPRGILTPLANILSRLPVSTIYAATNRSLGYGETLQSDIGKPDSTKVFTDWSYSDEEKNRKVFNDRIDLTDCDLNIPEFRMLTGRHRIRDRVFYELVRIRTDNIKALIGAPKQQQLIHAMRESIKVSKIQLMARLTSALSNRQGIFFVFAFHYKNITIIFFISITNNIDHFYRIIDFETCICWFNVFSWSLKFCIT